MCYTWVSLYFNPRNHLLKSLDVDFRDTLYRYCHCNTTDSNETVPVVMNNLYVSIGIPKDWGEFTWLMTKMNLFDDTIVHKQNLSHPFRYLSKCTYMTSKQRWWVRTNAIQMNSCDFKLNLQAEYQACCYTNKIYSSDF